MEEKIIFEDNNEILVSQVCEILKEKGIPFVRRDEGVGSYLNSTWGSNSGVKRIYVSNEDYFEAEKLLKIFTENMENQYDSDIPEELKEIEENEEDLQKEINKYKNMKRILFLGIPLVFILILITFFIIEGLN